MSTDALATPMPEGGGPRVVPEELPDLPAEGVERLTQDQRRAVQLILRGETDAQIGRVLGWGASRVARQRTEDLADAVRAGRLEALERAANMLAGLTPQAVRVWRRIMRDADASAEVRRRAAADVMDHAERLAQVLAGMGLPIERKGTVETEDPVQLARRVVRLLAATGMTPGEIAALATQEAK